MSNKNLYLIGTIHPDIKGPRRLEGLLNEICPDIIALEFHKDREDLINLIKSPEEIEREFEQLIYDNGLNLTPRQKRTYIESEKIYNSIQGYELKTCRKYVQENTKTVLEFIDLSLVEKGKKKFIDDCTEGLKLMFSKIVNNPEMAGLFLEILDKGIDEYIQESQKEFEILYKNVKFWDELAESMKKPNTFEILKEQFPENVVQTLVEIINPLRDKTMASRIKQLYNDGSFKLAAVVGILHLPGLKSRILELEPTVLTLADYNSHYFI